MQRKKNISDVPWIDFYFKDLKIKTYANMRLTCLIYTIEMIIMIFLNAIIVGLMNK